MRLPHSDCENVAKAGKKKLLEAVSVFDSAGIALKEFGITESGNDIQCYVPVSLGDILTLGFEIPCTEGQIVDIFIDGVLRETNVTTSRNVNFHRGKIQKVCACEIRPSGVKGKLEYCDMVVENRKTTKDIGPSGPGFADLQPSAVGSIEVRILREIRLTTRSRKDVKPEQATRGPTFEDNLRWWDVSKRVDADIATPTYQIGFVNGRKTQGNSRKNINRSIEGYYLWASFRFLYRSASDIQAAGFYILNNPPNLSSDNKAGRSANLTGKMANVEPAAALTTDGKPFLSLKALPELSINHIEPDINQPSELGTDRGTTVVTHDDLEDYDIVENQRSVDRSSNKGHFDDLADTEQGRSKQDVTEANPEEQHHDHSQLEKQASFPGSRRAALIIAEQSIASYTGGADMIGVQGKDLMPVLSNLKDSQDDAAVDEAFDCRGGSIDPSESSFGKSHQKSGIERLAEVALSLTSGRKNQLELSNPSQINSTEGDEFILQTPESQNSSDAASSPAPFPLLYKAGAEATFQEPSTGQEIEVVPLQIVPDIQRTAPNSLIRAKAGHYATRSRLVAPDTDEMERYAKAMTNGKGDWRNRVTQMLEVLSAPSKTHALEQPAARNLATVSLSNSVSDKTKKRTFGDFNVDTDGVPGLRSGNRNNQSISPKVRLEEHARKKQARQEALELAKAEAEALRQQVAEIEAGHAEAMAREEAELQAIDAEIERVQQEAEDLRAQLREIQEQ